MKTVFTGEVDNRFIVDIKKIHNEAMNNFYSKFPEMIKLQDKLLIVELNNRMRSVAGRALYSSSKIKINYRLHLKNYKELKATYIHELAHILTDSTYSRKNCKPHGKEWQEIMRIMGEAPEVTHNMDTSHLKAQTVKFNYTCPCNTSHFIGKIKHNRIMSGRRNYICRLCKQRIFIKK
jgi:predicted SprT family Zn-dependent metalloprotease